MPVTTCAKIFSPLIASTYSLSCFPAIRFSNLARYHQTESNRMSLPTLSETLSAVSAEFSPATEHERFLVETMAEARFRLTRLRGLSSIALNRLLETAANPGSDLEIGATALNKVEQLIAAAERSYYRAHRELVAAQRARIQAAAPPEAKAIANDSALLDLLLQIPERATSAPAASAVSDSKPLSNINRPPETHKMSLDRTVSARL